MASIHIPVIINVTRTNHPNVTENKSPECAAIHCVETKERGKRRLGRRKGGG